MSQLRKFSVGRVARPLLICYLMVCLVMLFLENSLTYPAPRYPGDGDWNAATYQAEETKFTSADNTALHGWYWEHPQPRAHLLYCHGNGDCVGYLGGYLARMSREHELSIFVFDYRGYGRSEGSPGEQGILEDAAAARAWLANRAGIPPTEIVLMGRSLGGGVAVDLAANQEGIGWRAPANPNPRPIRREFPFGNDQDARRTTATGRCRQQTRRRCRPHSTPHFRPGPRVESRPRSFPGHRAVLNRKKHPPSTRSQSTPSSCRSSALYVVQNLPLGSGQCRP